MFSKSRFSPEELFSAAATLSVQDTLALRASLHPDRTLFTWLDDAGKEQQQLSYQTLYRQACSVASQLEEISSPGDRVVLFFPQGLEFIATFLGCLIAGRIAVPVNMPNRRRLERCSKIVHDSGATLGMGVEADLDDLQAMFADCDLGFVSWSAPQLDRQSAHGESSPQSDRHHHRPPAASREQVAFLQYTSGSTSDPKGVMVTQHNITTNLRMMRDSWELSDQDTIVTWQPHHHDMGLILGQLLPIVLGNHTVIMAPNTFVRQPSIWLQAISDYRATMAGGPNFAYNLAVERYSAEKFTNLDLSSWTIALNGADVVRSSSLSRFAEVFGLHGFKSTSYLPCYGLAEATLFVSGGPCRRPIRTVTADVRVLEHDRKVVPPAPGHEHLGRELVGCGEPSWEVEVAIVDPDSGARCDRNEMGEIWLRGDAMAAGYWQNEAATDSGFNARISGMPDHEPGYMRTGDLGFVGAEDNEIYIGGRMKDLIICDGRNIHPEDIEYSILESFDAFRPPSCAVFSLDDAQGKQMVVAAVEINRDLRKLLNSDARSIKASIRTAVVNDHAIAINRILFILPTSMRKTTSGKIQRRLMHQLYQRGELDEVNLS